MKPYFSVQDPQNYWLQKLRQLNPNVSRAKGDGAARFAPHKPLLLLALLDLAEQAGPAGIGPFIALSADLRVRFLESLSIVVARLGTKPEIRLPFYHLSSQEFWKPLRADGTPSARPGPAGSLPKTNKQRPDPLELRPRLGAPVFRQMRPAPHD